MKLSDWYKQGPKPVLIRSAICLILLAGIVLFRRQNLSKQDLVWIAFAGLIILFVTIFYLFGAGGSKPSEKGVPEEKD